MLWQYGELQALAHIKLLAGMFQAAAADFRRAEQLQSHVLSLLWHDDLSYLTTLKVDPPTEIDPGALLPSQHGALCWKSVGRSVDTQLSIRQIEVPMCDNRGCVPCGADLASSGTGPCARAPRRFYRLLFRAHSHNPGHRGKEVGS